MSILVRLSRSLARPALIQSKTKCSSGVKPLITKRTNFSYREEYVKDEFGQKLATLGGFLITLYVGYNCYFHSDHLTGHFPDIIPEEWTDAELGIPPDDEDVYPAGYTPAAQQ